MEQKTQNKPINHPAGVMPGERPAPLPAQSNNEPNMEYVYDNLTLPIAVVEDAIPEV